MTRSELLGPARDTGAVYYPFEKRWYRRAGVGWERWSWWAAAWVAADVSAQTHMALDAMTVDNG